MRPHLSLWGVMALIVAIAVGIAALRQSTELWASIAFTASLAALSLASAYMAHRRGARRAFWAAFVAFGSGYLLLAFGPWCETVIRPRLLTTRLLDALFPMMHPTPVSGVRLWDAVTGVPIGGISLTPAPDRGDFHDIGHSIAALLLASMGGIASRYFHVHRDERRRETAEKAVGVLLKVLEAGL